MLSSEQKSYISNFIKHYYVINLPHRVDRLNNIRNEVKKIGFNNLEQSNIIEGIKFPDLHYIAGRAGNSAAMCKTLTAAYNNGYENFLLLEDDAFFIDERLDSLYKALIDLERINWDVLFLGARVKSPMTIVTPNLFRLYKQGCFHSVLLNRKIIKYILNLLPAWDAGADAWINWVSNAANECFDVWFSKIFSHNTDFFILHTTQLCSLQLANFSDINQKHSDGINILENDFNKFKPNEQRADLCAASCLMYSATEVMLAHQYLYYVASNPIWSDYEYDQFCKQNGLEGNGGSDLESDYSEKVKHLARKMLANPR